MRIILLHLYLIVCFGAASSFTDTSVALGQDVSLKCEMSLRDVYWFLLKPPEPPLFILRSYSGKTVDAVYNNSQLMKRFSLQYNSTLLIHNISANELGVYHCIKTQHGSPSDISSGIRLYIQNHSAENRTLNNKQENQLANNTEETCHCLTPLFISGVINCVLTVLLTVLTACLCGRARKTQAQPPDPGLQQSQNNADPEYDQVQYNTTNGHVRTTNNSSTYALLQAPKP